MKQNGQEKREKKRGNNRGHLIRISIILTMGHGENHIKNTVLYNCFNILIKLNSSKQNKTKQVTIGMTLGSAPQA